MTALDLPVVRPIVRLANRPRAREMPAPSVATWVVVAATALAAWVVLFALVMSGVQEHRSQRVLYAKFREQLAAATAPISGTIDEGAPVALLSIPAAGLDRAVVVQGTGADVLRAGPGHRADTVLPGQPGVSVLYGKGSTYGRPFRKVPSLHSGDQIAITTGQGTFHYVVDDVRTAGDRLPPALAAGASRLTLVTATGAGWRGGWAPDRVVYVDASLTGKAAAPTSVATSALPADEAAMQSDKGGWLPLVLWLELLLVGAVGLVIASVHWGRWQAWLTCTPVVLAALWGATQAAALLTPNLL